jgi:hypothetical protein
MKSGMLLAALIAAAVCAGCIAPHAAAPEAGFSAQGVPLNYLLRLQSTKSTEFDLFRVTNPLNLTFYVEYDFRGSTDSPSPLAVCLITDNGSVLFPEFLKRESSSSYATRNPSPFVVAGPVNSPAQGPLYDTDSIHGAEIINTSATSGWLVVAWANATGPVSVDSHWKNGTVASRIPTSSEIRTASLRDFQGGASAGTQGIVGANQGTHLKLGNAGQRYLVVAAFVTDYAKGTLTLSDNASVRTLTRNPGDLPVLRFVGEFTGPLTVSSSIAAGAGRTQVFLCLVPLASPLLPPGSTWQRLET